MTTARHSSRLAAWVKAAMDRIVAALLLVLLSPFLLAIAAAIWWQMGPPILFRQVRPGLQGRPFAIIKFRTMDDAAGAISGDDDEARLTPLGRFLRASSLDELPALVNVLKGEMSFVGPRPLLVEYLPLYTPRQARRHEVRPGITGLAQVNGRNQLEWKRRFRYDVWYVDNWTLWLDLKILLLTAERVVTQHGVTAEGHATMPAFQGVRAPAIAGQGGTRRAPAILRLSFRLTTMATAAAAAVALFVAFVDPYGVMGVVQVPGLNDQKTHRLDNGGRVARSLELWAADPELVILGGTRTWAGIDPASPVLASQQGYNAALPEATAPELVAVGRFLLDEDPPRRVIIGLSFSMFEGDRTYLGDFERSGFDGDRMSLVLLRSLVSTQSLIDALQTLRSNISGAESCDQENGLHLCPPSQSRPVLRFSEALETKYLGRASHYLAFDYDPSRVAELGRLLTDLAEAGIEVDIFTAPTHAYQMEAIRASGLSALHERWLTDLTRSVDAANRAARTSGAVRLWDFSGYSSVTTEPVPKGPPERAMRWYRNSSIFTPTLGDMVLRRMLEGPLASHPDFGVQLTPATLPATLAAKRAQRERYAAANPAAVAEISRLVESYRNGAPPATPGSPDPLDG